MPELYTIEGHPSILLFVEEHVCVVWDGNTSVDDTLSFEQYLEMGHVSTGFGIGRQLSIKD